MGKRSKLNEDQQLILDKASVTIESVNFWEIRINSIFDRVDFLETIKHLNKKQEKELEALYGEIQRILSRFKMEMSNMDKIETDMEKYINEEK
jgi:hypothetical protein